LSEPASHCAKRAIGFRRGKTDAEENPDAEDGENTEELEIANEFGEAQIFKIATPGRFFSQI
jgi:hypothetical protein